MKFLDDHNAILMDIDKKTHTNGFKNNFNCIYFF